jgi:hypothetical protein
LISSGEDGLCPIGKRPTIGNDLLHEIGSRLNESRSISF